MIKRAPQLLAVAGISLAAVSGVMGAAALSSGAQPPSQTVTIDIPTGGPTGPTGPQGPPGARGPAGPAGPTGPAGLACPSGFAPGELVFNAPQGHVRTWTCIHS